MKFSRVERLYIYRHRYAIASIIFAIMAIFAQWWAIDSLLPGISPLEAQSGLKAMNLSLNNLVDAPYYALQKISLLIPGETIIGLRSASMLISMLTSGMVLLIIRHWYGWRTALAGALLFATSSWWLSAARLGSPLLMQVFWVAAILLVLTKVWRNRNSPFWFIAAGVVFGLSLYTPRMIYLILFIVGLGFIELKQRGWFGKRRRLAALTLGITSLLFVPLLIGMYFSPNQALQLLGLNGHGFDIVEYGNSLQQYGSNLVWQREYNPELGLTVLPRLNIATAALALLGLIVFAMDWQSNRSRLMLSTLVVTFTAATFPIFDEGNHYLTLVPIYILVAVGIHTLLKRWNLTFPLNPLARVVGLLPIIALVGGLAFTNLRQYYTGWSMVPETQNVFSESAFRIRDVSEKFSEESMQTFYLTASEAQIARYTARDMNVTIIVPTEKTLYNLSTGQVLHFSANVYETLDPVTKKELSEHTLLQTLSENELDAIYVSFVVSGDDIIETQTKEE